MKPATPLPWKPSRCKVDGFFQYRIERQTGPRLRDDYEFLLDVAGVPMEFRSRHEAESFLRMLGESL